MDKILKETYLRQDTEIAQSRYSTILKEAMLLKRDFEHTQIWEMKCGN